MACLARRTVPCLNTIGIDNMFIHAIVIVAIVTTSISLPLNNYDHEYH